MTKLRTIFAATVMCISALPATAQTVFSVPQDRDFFEANMRWNGATAKGYDAFMALKNVDGQLVLCGVGVVTNIQLNTAINSALRGGTVKINGKTVLKDFRFFAKAKNTRSLGATKANCKSTGVAVPKKSDKLNVRYGRGTFRN